MITAGIMGLFAGAVVLAIWYAVQQLDGADAYRGGGGLKRVLYLSATTGSGRHGSRCGRQLPPYRSGDQF